MLGRSGRMRVPLVDVFDIPRTARANYHLTNHNFTIEGWTSVLSGLPKLFSQYYPQNLIPKAWLWGRRLCGRSTLIHYIRSDEKYRTNSITSCFRFSHFACDPPLRESLYLDTSNVIAWCIVPWFFGYRTPEQRIRHAQRTGYTAICLWLERTTSDGDGSWMESLLNKNNIKIDGVWMYDAKSDSLGKLVPVWAYAFNLDSAGLKTTVWLLIKTIFRPEW